MKVVINACFGGFGLSHEATMRYAELSGFELYVTETNTLFTSYSRVSPENRAPSPSPQEWANMTFEERRETNRVQAEQNFYDKDLARDDPVLVKVVEEMGEKASGRYARLKVVEIPDGVDWEIKEYDGNEHVAEVHRTWS